MVTVKLSNLKGKESSILIVGQLKSINYRMKKFSFFLLILLNFIVNTSAQLNSPQRAAWYGDNSVRDQLRRRSRLLYSQQRQDVSPAATLQQIIGKNKELFSNRQGRAMEEQTQQQDLITQLSHALHDNLVRRNRLDKVEGRARKRNGFRTNRRRIVSYF